MEEPTRFALMCTLVTSICVGFHFTYEDVISHDHILYMGIGFLVLGYGAIIFYHPVNYLVNSAQKRFTPPT